MEMRQKLAAGAIAMLLATGPTWAMGDRWRGGRDYQPPKPPPTQGTGQSAPKSTPEIDAASGTSAIALLAGALLLMRERARSRRS